MPFFLKFIGIYNGQTQKSAPTKVKMNKTTDPAIRSFLPVEENSQFPIQNLPYGVFQPCDNSMPRIGVAIGDWILDLSALEAEGIFSDILGGDSTIFAQRYLNGFMSKGPSVWRPIRNIIHDLLLDENPKLRDDLVLRNRSLKRAKDARLLLPVQIGDYTDFYSSKEHASNVGKIFRGEENALPPNWLHMPIAYHGRASSVMVSGKPVYRPSGQILSKKSDNPIFAESAALDYELEMGFFIGPGSHIGKPISLKDAKEHIFGMVLVNDWSARDIQKWEYQPLGPFLGKNFATTISPWIVTMEALEPFRCEGPVQDPKPLPYLQNDGHRSYNINLEVEIKTQNMENGQKICRSNTKFLYWDMYQQLAHHSVNGCNLRTGDLLASGTISGPAKDSFGSLLESTWQGSKPVELSGGEERRFLEDGDSIIMTGWCQGDDYRIGFGEAAGTIYPANR
jgi:fumarylacetoacetase